MIRLELEKVPQKVLKAIQAVSQEIYSIKLNIDTWTYTVKMSFRDYEAFKQVVTILDEEEFYPRDMS